MTIRRILAGSAALATLAGGLAVAPAQADDDIIITLGTRYCTTTVTVDAARPAAEADALLTTLAAKAQPLVGESSSHGRTVRLELGPVDKATRSFTISTMNYDMRVIDELYRYDYKVASFDKECMTAW